MFPLLAVLICAMGALVLLLLSVTRQARLQAVREAAAKNAEKQSGIAAEMEMVQWRVEQLKTSRKETEAQLAESRRVLGHIEDHGRRLRDRFQELSRQAKQAADEGLRAGRFVAAGEAELRQVEGQIAEAQQRLAQARQAAANRPKSYAIVPYDGRNGTRRRPIYIECRGDAVVLQPENVVFNEADFDEPLGPGNPLAAAIRAAREQMLLQGGVDPQNAGEPYPLLLVRPAGIAAYDAALAAVKSWGSEFGYELINEDWQLKYPPPNPNVARSVAQAVFLARLEHARLIAAAPSKYGKRPGTGNYRLLAGGEAGQAGRAGEGESRGKSGGESGGESPGFYASKPADRYARSAGGGSSATSGRGGGSAGGGGSGFGDSAASGLSSVGSGGSDGPKGDAEFAANNPYAAIPVGGMIGAPGMNPGGPGNGLGYGPGNAVAGGPGPGVAGGVAAAPGTNPGGPGNGSPLPAPGSPLPAPGSPLPAPGSPSPTAGVARPEGYITGQPNDGNPPPVQPKPSSAVAMVPATPLRPGEWRPLEETTPPKPDPAAEEKEKNEKKKHPYDKVKLDHDQDDWALRNATRHAAAISRPVHVDCYADRIVLVPEAGGGEPRVILCDRGGRRDADKLVAAVWEIMDTWGMAGREMYWRPVLKCYVAPGAEPRMFDLTRSLEGSGLVIERKQ